MSIKCIIKDFPFNCSIYGSTSVDRNGIVHIACGPNGQTKCPDAYILPEDIHNTYNTSYIEKADIKNSGTYITCPTCLKELGVGIGNILKTAIDKAFVNGKEKMVMEKMYIYGITGKDDNNLIHIADGPKGHTACPKAINTKVTMGTIYTVNSIVKYVNCPTCFEALNYNILLEAVEYGNPVARRVLANTSEKHMLEAKITQLEHELHEKEEEIKRLKETNDHIFVIYNDGSVTICSSKEHARYIVNNFVKTSNAAEPVRVIIGGNIKRVINKTVTSYKYCIEE